MQRFRSTTFTITWSSGPTSRAVRAETLLSARMFLAFSDHLYVPADHGAGEPIRCVGIQVLGVRHNMAPCSVGALRLMM